MLELICGALLQYIISILAPHIKSKLVGWLSQSDAYARFCDRLNAYRKPEYNPLGLELTIRHGYKRNRFRPPYYIDDI